MNLWCVALAFACALAGCSTTNVDTHAPAPLASDAVGVLKDTLVAGAVKAKITADEPDSIASLGVSSRSGAVTLRGTVLTVAARDRAAADAKSVAGVTSLDDRLTVNPNGPRPKEQAADFALAARIEAALAVQVGITHVGVHVDHGVATLDGSVPDEKTKATAVATARGTSGIRNVVDRIRVERS